MNRGFAAHHADAATKTARSGNTSKGEADSFANSGGYGPKALAQGRVLLVLFEVSRLPNLSTGRLWTTSLV